MQQFEQWISLRLQRHYRGTHLTTKDVPRAADAVCPPVTPVDHGTTLLTRARAQRLALAAIAAHYTHARTPLRGIQYPMSAANGGSTQKFEVRSVRGGRGARSADPSPKPDPPRPATM
eukprot:COSAG01_NODE_20554_length_945_cov_0.982332_1_plen_117_part_10